ncbi:MAG: hypothetical protein AAGA33_11880 [Pseudomonadota bacterium]
MFPNVGRAVLTALLLVSASALSAVAGDLEQDDPPSYLKTFSLGTSGLSGEGAIHISRLVSDADFVLFGEQHGVENLAAVVQAVMQQTKPDVLVTERGRWISQRMQILGVNEAFRRYPYSVAFDYDGELSLLRAFEALGGSTEMHLWGVDQPVTAIHPLQWLADESNGLESGPRRVARGLLTKATLHAGEYLRKPYFEDWQRLRAEIPQERRQIHETLDQLETSMRIYTLYRANRRAEAAKIREQLMIDALDEQLGAFERTYGSYPSMLMRLGGAHVTKGVGSNGVPTLGDHVETLAARNELDAVHIGIRRYDEDSLPSLKRYFNAAGTHVFVNLVEMQRLAGVGTEDNAVKTLLSDVKKYDAIILIGGNRERRESSLAFQARWNVAFVSSLGVFLIPAALLLIAVMVGVSSIVIQVLRARRDIDLIGYRFGALVLSALLVATVVDSFVAAIFNRPSFASGLPDVYGLANVVVATSACFCTLRLAIYARQNSTKADAGFLWIMSILIAWLGLAIHYWDLPY